MNSRERLGSPGAPDGRPLLGCTVVVCAPERTSARLITDAVETIAACGAHAEIHHNIAASIAAPSAAPVAVIVAGDAESDVAAATTRLLKHRGFEVIAVLDEAGGPALVASCRLLMAGCSAVVDRASRGWCGELRAQLIACVAAAIDRTARTRRLRETMDACGFVGESAAIVDVFASVQRLAAVSDLPTVITGETGTGKERIARALHTLDEKRRHHPFVAVNCGAIASTLAESELFGHRRGAFTHAHRDRAGLVRAAHRGVLFLDEIAELDASIQTKLLRVLQEGRVLAVGDEADVAVDVRIVAATNRPLAALVDEGRFRADLYHRLNVLSISIPPLRDRRSDIPRLVEHFARLHGARSGRPPLTVHPAFMEAMGRLDLPGNARQLENIVRCALVKHDGDDPLDIRDLPSAVWSDLVAQSPSDDDHGAAQATAETAWTTYPVRTLAAHNWDLSRSLESCERSMVEAALCETHGNQSRAARLLGITARSVYTKLRRYRSA